MCLQTATKTPTILTKPMTVYKNCRIKWLDANTVTLHGQYVRKHQYSETETARLRIRKSIDMYEINSGLHAYTSERYSANTKWIIPAGATIYRGSWTSHGEIVATEMSFSGFTDGAYKIVWAKSSLLRTLRKHIRYYFGY